MISENYIILSQKDSHVENEIRFLPFYLLPFVV